MSFSLLLLPSPDRASIFSSPPKPNPFAVGRALKCKVQRVHWTESQPLESSLTRLLSSFLHFPRVHARAALLLTLPSWASPRSHPPAWGRAALRGSWNQKGTFSVEAACSSVNTIKDGFFLGEAGCSLGFSLKPGSCIQRTIPLEVPTGGESSLTPRGRARPV